MNKINIKYDWTDGGLSFEELQEHMKNGTLPPVPIEIDADVYLILQDLIKQKGAAFKDITTSSEAIRSLIKMVHECDKQATADDDYIERLEAEVKSFYEWQDELKAAIEEQKVKK